MIPMSICDLYNVYLTAILSFKIFADKSTNYYPGLKSRIQHAKAAEV